MEDVSHINHVVLYAKNWYRHTGDVCKDLLQIIRLDHPDKNILTKKELHDQMMSDYEHWISSLPEGHSERDYLVNKSRRDDFGVRWESDEELSHIWSILISYSIFIKDFDNVLQPPVYDFKNNLWPQFNCYPVNPFGAIPKGSPEKAYTDAAKRYLSSSPIDVLKTSFMSAKYNFNYDLVFRVLAVTIDENFIDDYNKSEKWLRGLMYKLWNTVRKKIKDGTIDKRYDTIRVGPMLAHVSLDRCDFDLCFVTEFGSASASDAPEILLETDTTKQMEMLFDKAASKLNRTKLKKTFEIDNYSGIGLHIREKTDITPDEFIDDHLDCLKEAFILDKNESLSSSKHMKSGIFDMSMDVENKRVTVWYALETSFGCHEHSLRNGEDTDREHL